jgi:hypothetical protein
MHYRWRVVLFAPRLSELPTEVDIIHGFLQVHHCACLERTIPIGAAVAPKSVPPFLDNWDLPIRDNPASQTPKSWQNYGN